jgi:hypothetical protein
MILPMVIEKGYEHCRSPKVLPGDFLFLMMTEDFYNLLLHGAVIIALLKVSNIARFRS